VWDLVVIGGGPAGMTAAGRAAERGKQVILLEKNHTLGKKLLVTGGGRCNVTNAITDRHVLTGRYGKDGVHLHSLFARFGPEDTRTLLRRFGLETKVEAEGRVFPVTDNAASVRAVLEEWMARGNVTIRRNCRVAGLVMETLAPSGISTVSVASATPPRVGAIRTERNEIIAGREFVLSTGGTARPDTGSTGDALPWLRELGVPVRVAESALVPLKVPDRWVRDLQGLALADAELIVQAGPGTTDPDWANARRALIRRGKLLFTHFGLSGPVALNAAADIRELAQNGPIRLLINPLPGTDPAEVEQSITRAVAASGSRSLGKLLGQIVPPRMANAVCAVAGVDPAHRLATLSRKDRKTVVSVVTAMPCQFGGLMGQDKAIVSSGGVHPSAVDFRTMRLRNVPNVFVLGDLLDFNRQSGGFSLQMCWAGGWVAGEACGACGQDG
jgi:predicted Rossmann fold flavoprotein